MKDENVTNYQFRTQKTEGKKNIYLLTFAQLSVISPRAEFVFRLRNEAR